MCANLLGQGITTILDAAGTMAKAKDKKEKEKMAAWTTCRDQCLRLKDSLLLYLELVRLSVWATAQLIADSRMDTQAIIDDAMSGRSINGWLSR